MTVQRRRTPAPIDDLTPSADSATPSKPTASGHTPPRRLDPGPPAETVVLPYEAVRLESLGVGELLDLAEQLGTDLEGLASAMRHGGLTRARFLVGLAWIIARRSDPGLTYDDAARWRIEVEVGPPDPTPAAPLNGARPGL